MDTPVNVGADIDLPRFFQEMAVSFSKSCERPYEWHTRCCSVRVSDARQSMRNARG
jgi:hypothetical protein